MIFWIWLIAASISFILYLHHVYSKFERAGVKNRRPFPLLGNMYTLFTRTETLSHSLMKSYSTFRNERFFGHYQYLNPIIVVKDLELIKKITIKDYDYFAEHRAIANEEYEPFLSKSLFFMRGEKWRDMRQTISPAFTSSKIRQMVPFMVEVGNNMVASLKKKIQSSPDGKLEGEIKELTTLYTNDVVASCAFGVKVDSMSDDSNEFYLRGKEVTSLGAKEVAKMVTYMLFPRIAKLLKLSVFSEEPKKFFMNLITSVMKERKEKNIIRPDMIHLLMEAKKGNLSFENIEKRDEDAGFATVEESAINQNKNKREWEDIELISQAFIFFFAGFDSVSTVMVFLLMELAINQDIQEKVVEEILETETKNGGKFDYKTIQDMVYLDMVVSETLRLWPPFHGFDRLCTFDYNLGKPNETAEKEYTVKAGNCVYVSTFSIQRDPEHYPNPDKFDPERFSIENRKNIKPFTFMPFGSGPRNCIGSRFALCEVKVMVYQLLKEFKVEPCSKTTIPIELATGTYLTKIKGGTWVKLSLRK